MKYIFFCFLISGMHFTAAEEQSPLTTEADTNLKDEDPQCPVVTDTEGKTYFPKGRES